MPFKKQVGDDMLANNSSTLGASALVDDTSFVATFVLRKQGKMPCPR